MLRQTSIEVYTRPGLLLRAGGFLRLIRPRQWIKNVLLFAALIFSGQLFNPSSVWLSIMAFASFCMASSGIYCLNDVIDAEQDSLHPKKRQRPVASGLVSIFEALTVGTVLSGTGLLLGFTVAPLFGLVILSYLIINLFYCTWLKRIVLFDLMSIASGFVLRAAGGAVAINVVMSKWFLANVMLLSLFLAVAKRRHEVTTVEQAARHRSVLTEYPVSLLDQLTAVLSGAVIVTYLLYVIESGRTSLFFLTSPLVIYGVFRYLYLIHRRAEGGSPDELLLSDWPLLITVILWGIVSGVIIYLTHAAPAL